MFNKSELFVMKKNRTLKEKILLRMSLKKENVFLRGDFDDLGGYDQVGRVLKRLVDEQKLIRMGYGLYTQTQISPINGAITPRVNFIELAHQALARLGVKCSPSRALILYNSGRSTQVPTGQMIAVNKKMSRLITYKGARIYYERSA